MIKSLIRKIKRKVRIMKCKNQDLLLLEQVYCSLGKEKFIRLYELLKEKSNNKEMFKTKELIDTLNKFGEVERNEAMGDLVLYFKDDDSRDDIWIEKVDKVNCYITAYGCWDGRAGAMLFDNRDEYNKNIGWLKLTDEMIEDIENGNFKIKFEIKDPYMFEVGKEKDNK